MGFELYLNKCLYFKHTFIKLNMCVGLHFTNIFKSVPFLSNKTSKYIRKLINVKIKLVDYALRGIFN